MTDKTTVQTLLQLNSEIRKGTQKSKLALKIIGIIAALFALASLLAYAMVADAGQPRGTIAALSSFLVVAAFVLVPIIGASGGQGLQPIHVRHLPVSAPNLQRALLIAGFRSSGWWLTLVGLGIGVVAVATNGASTVGIVAAVLIAVLIAVFALALSRTAMLAFDSAMRTPAGRTVATVASVVLAAGAYTLFVSLGNVSTAFADNQVVVLVGRILPTGWAVTAAEAIDDGRWWLTLILVVALVAGTAALYKVWTSLLAKALEGAPTQSKSKQHKESEPTTARGPLFVAASVEAELLVKDPQRLGMLLMPALFVVIGVVLMFTSGDLYGLQYGAPVAVLISGTAFFNSYGLDRTSFWRIAVVPGAAARVISARMIVAGVVATAVGVAGTVVGRVVGDSAPSTLPLAIAVLIAGCAGTAAASGIASAGSPYKLPEGSAASAMSARGSMSGKAFGWSLGTMASIALLCVPGLLLGAFLPGLLAWIGPLVAAGLGAAAVVLGRRTAISMTTTRGPEIYAKVA